LRLPYVVSIDFWQYKVEVEVEVEFLIVVCNLDTQSSKVGNTAMAAPETTALLKRSKRSVAVSVKSECSRQNDSQKLIDLLDYLLNPEKPIDEFETLDWLRWLISGGNTFEEFAKNGKYYCYMYMTFQNNNKT